MVKDACFSEEFDVLSTTTTTKKMCMEVVGSHFPTFWYLSENNRFDKWWKVYTFHRDLIYLQQQHKKKKWSFQKGAQWWSVGHFQTFRYLSENNRCDKWWKMHTFQRDLTYFLQKKKKVLFSLRRVVVVRSHFPTFWNLSENNRFDKWWKVHTFQRDLTYFQEKKKKKKVEFSLRRVVAVGEPFSNF